MALIQLESERVCLISLGFKLLAGRVFIRAHEPAPRNHRSRRKWPSCKLFAAHCCPHHQAHWTKGKAVVTREVSRTLSPVPRRRRTHPPVAAALLHASVCLSQEHTPSLPERRASRCSCPSRPLAAPTASIMQVVSVLLVSI